MTRKVRPAGQRGFSLILAVFLLVSLAAMGAFLLTVSTMQQESVTVEEQGARAYQAARAGIDWAAYRVLRDGVCASQTLTLDGGLSGFSAQVTCTSTGPFTEGGLSVTVYRITSNGCNQGTCPGAAGPGYVERELQITLTRTS
jgi:MSHA biogenesis protein MshP